MRLGIKAKQVLGVTSIVGAVVVVLSVLHLARLARVSLDESRARAELLANAIFHRAREVVGRRRRSATRRCAPIPACGRSSSRACYSKNVTFAAIVDAHGVAVAHADPRSKASRCRRPATCGALLGAVAAVAARARSTPARGATSSSRSRCCSATREFGSIRIGVSTLLIRSDLDESLRPALVDRARGARRRRCSCAMLLAQLLLRPIHVIRSGLTRLGRGEFGVRLDLDQHDEFGELGTFFNTVSAQLSADRSQMAGQVANLESASSTSRTRSRIVNPRGELLFANPAMRALLPGRGARRLARATCCRPIIRCGGWPSRRWSSRQSRGPLSAAFDATSRRAAGA